MLSKVLMVVVALLLAFLGYVAFQPSEYVIERSLVIQADPAEIYPYLNNSRKMYEWSPWSKIDPEAKMEFSGPEEGVGATTSWSAGKQLGTGKATITEVSENSYVKTQLDYTEPFEMSQKAELSLTAEDAGTSVKWSVEGHNNYIGRLVCVFMDMDKMVGDNFLLGLGTLKDIIESPKSPSEG